MTDRPAPSRSDAPSGPSRAATTQAAPHPSANPRAATRDRALDAAHACVLDLGIDRTTMVEVSRRSGLGRTTLYRHWPHSTALLTDLLTRELTSAVAHLGPDAPDPTAPRSADEIVDLTCDLADQIRTDPLLEALRRDESSLLSEYLLRRLGTSQRTLIDLLRTVLAQSDDQRLAGRDPDATATMLYLAAQGAVLSAPLADPPLDPPTWRAELHRLIRGYLLS
ncbi:TetR/AcrR family transcriptional regulator [Dietzia aerolata]|uniref:TetR/AcrR family transcriptional regulator n=2 Tax=Dietzia aerolata TaxID=595984 RepID=A0ABV5JSQ6_9ACTN|nr:TetR/AcrR family transcriptional regulator [Candidatus Dietzia merdigallinarum]